MSVLLKMMLGAQHTVDNYSSLKERMKILEQRAKGSYVAWNTLWKHRLEWNRLWELVAQTR